MGVELTKNEFALLHLLMKKRGEVLTYKEMYHHVYGGEYSYRTREILWNAVKRLREKLKVMPDCPEYIENVSGVGYRFLLAPVTKELISL